MEYFAGLDVSLRSCASCVVDAKGKVMLEREIPCEVGDIADYLNSFDHPIERIGFEAGTLSQHLFYGLTREGFDVVCMEASQVNAALSAMRNKTDKNDARGIAHVLRTGWFSPVRMKSRDGTEFRPAEMGGAWHDLIRHPPKPNGVVPHRTRSVEETEDGCCAT